MLWQKGIIPVSIKQANRLIDKKLMDCILGHFADQATDYSLTRMCGILKQPQKKFGCTLSGGTGQLAYMHAIIHQTSVSFKYLKELKLKALTHKNTSLANSPTK